MTTSRVVNQKPKVEVLRVQRHLRKQGFKIEVDGVWGPQTQHAWSQLARSLKRGPVKAVERAQEYHRRPQFREGESQADKDTIQRELYRHYVGQMAQEEAERQRRHRPWMPDRGQVGDVSSLRGARATLGAVGNLAETADDAVANFLAQSLEKPTPEKAWERTKAIAEFAHKFRLEPTAKGEFGTGLGLRLAPEGTEWAVGPETAKMQKGESFDPKWLAGELALAPFFFGRPIKTSAQAVRHALSPSRKKFIEVARAQGMSKPEVKAAVLSMDELAKVASKRGVVKNPNEFYETFALQASEKEQVDQARALFQSNPFNRHDALLEGHELLRDFGQKTLRGGKIKQVAPPHLDTPEKIADFMEMMQHAALLNESKGRYWYRYGAQTIKNFSRNRKDAVRNAKKLAGLASIYSPRVAVHHANKRAVDAFEQWHQQARQGIPVAKRRIDTAGVKGHDRSAEKWMRGQYQFKPGQADKTRNFYADFLRYLDPEEYKRMHPAGDSATMDVHMAHLFQMDPGDHEQYEFMRRITVAQAERMGWQPDELQAAIWHYVKPLRDAESTRPKGLKKYAEEEAISDMEESLKTLRPGKKRIKDIQASIDRNAGDDLQGLPGKVKVGQEPVEFRAHKELQETAADYMQQAGLPYDPPRVYMPADPERGARVAAELERMPHAPDDPAVAAAYQAFADETLAQYRHLVEKTGIRFHFYPEGRDPYPVSPRQSLIDIHENKRMYVYPTREGFGLEGDAAKYADHPMLRIVEGVDWDGAEVTYNDLFRAVHDVYGHAKEGVGMRADGEFNAWRQHAAMYSEKARRAMTTETHGQNSWVNFGPHGAKNRTASTADTVFAEQKAGVMPDWTMQEGLDDPGTPGEVMRALDAEANRLMTATEDDAVRAAGRVAVSEAEGRAPIREFDRPFLEQALKDMEMAGEQDSDIYRQVQEELARRGDDVGEVTDLRQKLHPEVQEHLEAQDALARDVARTLPKEEWPAFVERRIRIQGLDPEDFELGNQWLAQGERGATEFLDDGRAIVHLFKGADPSTILHEYSHIARRYILNEKELAHAEKVYEVVDGQWTREAEEAFATDFERYIKEGFAPTPQLKKSFRVLRDALARIYANVRGMDGVNPEMREVFDSLLGGKPFKKRPEGAEAVLEALPRGAKARREQEVAEASEAAALETGGEAGYHAALEELRGKLPELTIQGVKMEQRQVDSLFFHIQAHSDLRRFEKIRTQSALQRILTGQPPTKSGEALLRRAFGPEFVDDLMENVSRQAKVKHYALEVWNVPRSLMATFDLSAPFRQALLAGISYPGIFFSNFPEMVKAFGSPRVYEGIQDDIVSRANYERYGKGGLATTDIGGAAAKREEQFYGSLAEDIPGVGIPVRASQRAFTAFLAKMRADVFDYLHADAVSRGYDPDDEELLKGLATFINSSTGRGDPGMFKSAMPFLNQAFFSPNLMFSRFNLFNPFYYARLHPYARKQALKSLFKFVGVVGTILTLADKSGHADVGIDPRSANFLKIRIGNNRIDIAGGFQQQIRIAVQLAKGEIVSSTTGEIMTLGPEFGQLSRKDILERFFVGKANPSASLIYDALTGKTFEGDPFEWKQAVAQRMLPLLGQDAHDIQQEKGYGKAALAYGVGAFGIGIQNYGPKTPNAVKEFKEDAEKYGLHPSEEVVKRLEAKVKLDRRVSREAEKDPLKKLRLVGEVYQEVYGSDVYVRLSEKKLPRPLAQRTYERVRKLLFIQVSHYERMIQRQEDLELEGQ